MRQSLQLKLGQQLTMTPQLQQAIRLLQLSSLDLQTEIQTVLDSNLMLEREEDGEFDGDGAAAEATPEATAATAEASTDAAAGDDAVAPLAAEVPAEPASAADETETAVGSDAEVSVSDNAPDELPVDSNWDDVYDSYDGATSYSKGDDDQQQSFEQMASAGESLHDFLIWQMELTPFSDGDRMIAAAIIDAIDSNGYLSLSLEDIQAGLNTIGDNAAGVGDDAIEIDEIEAVLHRVQRFDPAGVGARDAAECLLLQLEQLPADTPWLDEAKNLVGNHLETLAGRDFNGLMRRLKLSEDELREVVRLIQSLTPHPGVHHSNEEPEYIVPDVLITRQKENWLVELNPDNAPRVRINSQYASLVKRADSSADNQYMKNDLQEARWFLKSLQNRNETVLKVATCIVEHQRGFLEYGEEHMKPLVLRDIAEALEMHESTISRVTTQKYMHTPRGIFEFKYFFSSHVGTNEGGEASAVAIRAMIRKLIGEESPKKPLSDSKIAQTLGDAGINIARRTVAKYREQLSIPSSSERKRLI